MNGSGTSLLEASIGYRFKNRELLEEALTHKSFYYENPTEARTHNERLEFLGDSVLSLAVNERLYGIEPSFTEAEMSKMRSFIVKGAVLSEVAREISLGSYLRLSKGEEETGGRQKSSILSNALEALIGAVYIEGGLGEVRRLVGMLFAGRIDEVVRSGQYHDYKSQLQEECQTRFGELPEYVLESERGREHDKVFTMDVFISGKLWGRGTGKSKKKAQAEAARQALSKLPD